MNEVVAIAEKNSLHYYLAYGTLLGCVRHKGFVPWDDDIDIVLLRKDYEKLLKALKEELPDGCFLQDFRDDNMYWNPYAKV